jgi:hypothetical protein
MAWNFGWALSPTISGYLQIRYGFGPPFVLTILLYTVAIGCIIFGSGGGHPRKAL